jgi:hypothetical protein
MVVAPTVAGAAARQFAENGRGTPIDAGGAGDGNLTVGELAARFPDANVVALLELLLSHELELLAPTHSQPTRPSSRR